MTIAEFLDQVNWAAMRTGVIAPDDDSIRDSDSKCPICSVWGGRNMEADEIALAHGLVLDDAMVIMDAADNYCIDEDHGEDGQRARLELRADMLQRIQAARP